MTQALGTLRASYVWQQSDGDVTREFYRRLAEKGPIGHVALNLFRANKCSARAKQYRGGLPGRGSFHNMAYERKSWSIGVLSEILKKYGRAAGIRWGWKVDLGTPGYSYVIYVDLPQGQVSFHNSHRLAGPDYPGEWDGQKLSTERIVQFCDAVLVGGAA
jgi:hypothetical protein